MTPQQEINPHVKMSIEVKLMQCPSCKKERKLSTFYGEDTRNTWCITCRKSVIWQAVTGENQ